jgi:hypothetical protein
MKASTKELLDRSHTWFQKVNIETWAIGWVYPVYMETPVFFKPKI